MPRTLPVGVMKGAVRGNGRRGVVSTRFVEAKRCNRSCRGARVDECSVRRNAAAEMPSIAHGSNHSSIDMIDKLWTGRNHGLHQSTLIFHACRGQTQINANCLCGQRRRAAPNRRIWTGPSAGTSQMTPSRPGNPRLPPGKVTGVAIDDLHRYLVRLLCQRKTFRRDRSRFASLPLTKNLTRKVRD